jgi:putative oxidoreductase
MAVAYSTAHVATAGGLLTPTTNRSEAAVLYCFIFLFLASAGGGAFSLDRVRAARATRYST